MHILDFIMFFPCILLLWWILDKVFDGDFTEELGGLIGLFILFIFTIVYVIVFAIYPDWNWVDIFNGTLTINIKL